MQHETKKISTWTPGLTGGRSKAPIPRPEKPFKKLDYRNNGLMRPTFHVEPTGDIEYFGKPFSLNTKYIVDIEDDDVIGCHVTLASGKTVWIDESVASLTIMCNRR